MPSSTVSYVAELDIPLCTAAVFNADPRNCSVISLMYEYIVMAERGEMPVVRIWQFFHNDLDEEYTYP